MTYHKSFLATAMFAVAPLAAPADPFEIEPNTLLLGFQATGGQGANENVFFDLGSVEAFRDGTNPTVLGNIGADLAATYGDEWFDRAEVRFGVHGNRTNSPPTVDPGGTGSPVQDPGRTLYVSIPVETPGAGVLRANLSSSGASFMANSFAGMKAIFAVGGDPLKNAYGDPRPEATAAGAAVLNQTIHQVSWNNSWTVNNPSAAEQPSFGGWSPKIENNFGQGGTQRLVDVQRVKPSWTGNPATVTYEVTIAVKSNGEVTAISTTSSTPFQDWIGTNYNPPLTNPADRQAGADPDQDGHNNDYEFAFGGSPISGSDNGKSWVRTNDVAGGAQGDLTLTVEVLTGATFSASGNKLVASAQGVNYTIDGSLDLNTFNSQVLEVTPHLGTGAPKAGYQFKTFRLVASAGLTGKGFLRAGATVAP